MAERASQARGAEPADERMSEWTSEWPSAYVWILGYSGPLRPGAPPTTHPRLVGMRKPGRRGRGAARKRQSARRGADARRMRFPPKPTAFGGGGFGGKWKRPEDDEASTTKSPQAAENPSTRTWFHPLKAPWPRLRQVLL